MSYLASFPLYSHPDIAQAALDALARESDVFIPVNNPDLAGIVADVPHVINPTNNYCNGAWNQALRHFLLGTWDYLLLSSQDVILAPGWSTFTPTEPKTAYVPAYAPSLETLLTVHAQDIPLAGNMAGACTFLTRAAVLQFYPIPSAIKLWFGDQWMYQRLRKRGYTIRQAPVAAYHYGQLGSQANPETPSVIEQDKQAWETVKATV